MTNIVCIIDQSDVSKMDKKQTFQFFQNVELNSNTCCLQYIQYLIMLVIGLRLGVLDRCLKETGKCMFMSIKIRERQVYCSDKMLQYIVGLMF